MKPYIHAQNSVHKWGGVPEDYLPIHDFLDSSKSHFADMRHRALLHNSFGIYIAERIFGTYITNSAGKKVQVRDIGENHVIEDMGRIPSVHEYLEGMPMYDWLGGPKKRIRVIMMDDKKKAKKSVLLTGIEKARKEQKGKPFHQQPGVVRVQAGLPKGILD